ncbi:MAG: rane protein insertase [Pseudomonadota bacterium]
MSDIRRSILWVIFGFSMVLIWDKWQVYSGKAPTFFPSPAAVTKAADAPVPAEAPTAALAAKPGDVPAGAASSVPREKITVSSDVLQLTFDTEGGSLVGAHMLKHASVTGLDKNEAFVPLKLLSQEEGHTYVAQTGLIGGNFPSHKTPMRLVSSAKSLPDGQDSLTVRFESVPLDGVVLAKTYTLKRGAYDVLVKHEVLNRGSAAIKPQLYLQLVRDGSKGSSETPFYSTFTGPAVYSSTAKFEKIEFADIDKNKVKFQKTATDGYVSMVQHYFASAWLLGEGLERENFVRKIDNNLYSVGMIAAVPTIEPGQTQAVESRLFVGPQAEKTLEVLTPGLELVKDYGWVTILAKPLYWLLERIHSLVNNWGWAIVLLVVLIKAAFYWLNASAYRSMAKMKAINPRIQEMRERLKSNPQQMQMEMMKIYREEKVNPLGGCFPIMIQIPVFIALYWVLLASVEMRNAPWAVWITDLSTPDPYYILPFVMALTTVVQTALNPLPPDPMQAKLMWFMPLAFSVMFFFFPSGLVLYWITNNALTIAQQAFINHRMGVPLKFNMPSFK